MAYPQRNGRGPCRDGGREFQVRSSGFTPSRITAPSLRASAFAVAAAAYAFAVALHLVEAFR
jgi:hypothetical protein